MQDKLRLPVIIIAVVTVLTGFAQMTMPAIVLKVVGAEVTATTGYFFAIVGMFMVLFGMLLLHAVYSTENNQVAILWASMQKFGAFAAVGVGVYKGVFSIIAGLIAGFDLLTGILYLAYWKSRGAAPGD